MARREAHARVHRDRLPGHRRRRGRRSASSRRRRPHAVRRVRAARCDDCVPPRRARRHRRVAREGPAARHQHAGVRDRGRALHLRPHHLHRFRGRARRSTFERGKLGPFDLTHRNRGYYYFVARDPRRSCSSIAGHLRRTGIGRTIIGVRENEPGRGRAHGVADPGQAHRVRARWVHRRTRRRAARRPRGRPSATTSGSSASRTRSRSVAIAVIGGLGSLDRRGHRRACGSSACRRSGPTTTPCRSSRRASGCSSSCSTSRAGSRRSATGCAARILQLAREAAARAPAEDHHRTAARR